jgi:hypothetical protein
LLPFKLVLVPILIATVTLGARRWGPRIGGLLTAMPVVTGPTLCFYAIDHGARFGASAAAGTLFGLAGVLGFCVVYAHAALRRAWPIALAGGWAAFLAITFGLSSVPVNALVGLVMIVALCAVALRILPAAEPMTPAPVPPIWDLPLRMGAAVALVMVLTSAAGRLGPQLSGLLTPFPLATALIAAFTHAQRGGRAAVTFFHGFVPALTTFAVFCFILAVALPQTAMVAAIGAAFVVQLALQAVLLWRMRQVASLGAVRAA